LPGQHRVEVMQRQAPPLGCTGEAIFLGGGPEAAQRTVIERADSTSEEQNCASV
jgi:hypothetical protein